MKFSIRFSTCLIFLFAGLFIHAQEDTLIYKTWKLSVKLGSEIKDLPLIIDIQNDSTASFVLQVDTGTTHYQLSNTTMIHDSIFINVMVFDSAQGLPTDTINIVLKKIKENKLKGRLENGEKSVKVSAEGIYCCTNLNHSCSGERCTTSENAVRERRRQGCVFDYDN